MSVDVIAQVVGAEAVAARFDSGYERARGPLRDKVQSLGIELLRKIKEEKLTGQVLKVQTGRLRRSVNEETTEASDAITSTVGTNVGYGRAWELGFDGVEQVKAHARRTRRGGSAMVRAHSRRAHMAARPFLQPSLGEMKQRIRDEILATVEGVL